MSVVQAAWQSFRQAREVWLSGVALSIAALVLTLWHAVWPPMLQVMLWAFWALAMAFLLRRGWLKLLGPVLFYDMIRLARRGRYFYLRIGYVAVLLFFFFDNWYKLNLSIGSRHEPQRFYALVAERYFDGFMIIQLLAVCILTPAYVGGCIAEEKERKTLEFMLATDLRNREIILSKLMARLANLGLFVITGLPILSILQFLGGLDPNLVLAGFLATFMTVFGLAGFGILCSVHCKRSRDAIAAAYLGPLAYVALGLVGFGMQQSNWVLLGDLDLQDWAPALSSIVEVYNSGNLVVVLAKLARTLSFGQEIGTVLGGLMTDYVIFHVLFGLTCTLWAMVRLRAVALRQASEPPRKTKAGRRDKPAVGDDPVFWREVYVEGRGRTTWTTRLMLIGFSLMIVGIFAWMIIDAVRHDRFMQKAFTQEVNIFVAIIGTILSCLIVLGCAVRASTCISSERDKDTFDFLLTTPLDSDAILWGKFLGNLYSMRPAFYGLGVIWLTGIVFGGMTVEFVPLLAAVLVYAAAFSMVGLWFSTVCRSGIRATLATVMTTVAIAVGHWVPCTCCYVGAHGGDGMKLAVMAQGGITPPAVLGYLHSVGMIMRHEHWNDDVITFLVFCLFGIGVYAAGAIGFWNGALSPKFREATHRGEKRSKGRPPLGGTS